MKTEASIKLIMEEASKEAVNLALDILNGCQEDNPKEDIPYEWIKGKRWVVIEKEHFDTALVEEALSFLRSIHMDFRFMEGNVSRRLQVGTWYFYRGSKPYIFITMEEHDFCSIHEVIKLYFKDKTELYNIAEWSKGE